MQYINNLILFIIYINILFSVIILARYLIRKIAETFRYSSLKQYRINNWYFTLFCTLFYITFPVVGLYCLRLYNLDRSLDLKVLYQKISKVITIGLNLNILFLILFMFIIINILLSIIYIYKLLTNEIYKLYLYIRYNTQDRNKINDFIWNYKLGDYRDTDLISFWIKKFIVYLYERWVYYKNNLIWQKMPAHSPEYEEWRREQLIFIEYCEKRPWYHLELIFLTIIGSRYYKFIVLISPLIVIVYDCIFNDFILVHVYYYLLLYVPVMLWRKVTIKLATENERMAELIWDILYKKETCIYALREEDRKLFDIYIANGILMVDLGLHTVMDFDASWSIYRSAQFVFNEKENLYYNKVDRSLEYTEDKRLVYRHLDYNNMEEEVDEEWYIIAKKYNYIEEDKSITIVFVDQSAEASANAKSHQLQHEDNEA